ncbi:hypothetical protein HPB52_010478 [Rhipicephalus sanguineus]|uniref:CCHC-type domain-containing protein n=1 Tax=Rhipicephalus sanguineus TaxID=34632 RepID=A0A9D4PNJ8_RHISA|nr:hypothetical protein HPB52_010478 [Rhipicephalus sanguineus]
MEVQVNGEDISPEEFLEGAGWCTIGSKTQANHANAQSNNQTGAHSRTGEGADGNRQRSRQQHRNVRQQVIRNSKMPLSNANFKIVVRPRGGLDVATTGTVRLASAIYRAANVPAHEAGEDTVCSNNHQNIIVGIIKGIPLEEDAKSIHTNIVHALNPQALAAKRLSNTTTVIVAFEGPRVPTYVRYGGALLRCVLYRKQIDMCHCCGRLGHRMDVCPNPQDKVCRGCGVANPDPDHQCSPRCKLCGGTHMTADRNCRARYKTPYVVTKRQWERRRAAEEAEAAAATGPAGKPRSRSRTRRTPTGYTKTAESVSFADTVKGKRAPNAEAGGKTPTKIETEIAQLTQAMQAMKRQIEHMQAQIRAKDELIQQLQSAANSETDPQAMQETQEEPTEDDEVECPDTKRRLAPTPLKAARLKRTRAAIRDARLEALEGRLSSLEETITATITRTIQQSLESVHLRLSRLEAANSTLGTSHSEAAPHI